nr:soluble trehalase [Dioryctria sylvestrella]
MMWQFFLLLTAAPALTSDLPPSCDRPVYCNSSLLHHVQLARLYPDSKTFVDNELRYDSNTTLAAFDQLLNETDNNPSKEQLQSFVQKYFNNETNNELEYWMPPDYSENPDFLNNIRDEDLRQFAKDINGIWPDLGRKVSPNVSENPDRYSLVPVSQGFIIPGGRFKELYYWDTYWIIEGLLISGMHDTVKGVIENLIELLKQFGHIPNGSRWYYQQRSQPPLLAAMISLYFRETRDTEFLAANIDALEEEIKYWLDTQIVTFDKDGRTYTLLRYYAPSEGPRPESYYEDWTDAQQFDSEERRKEFYIDIKSAAESGWDFSSRWFVEKDGSNNGNLTNIHTKYLIPVDLNSIFTNSLNNMAYFKAILKKPNEAAHWGYLAKQWSSSIAEVLWNDEDGIWYDYDMKHKQHRKYFYPSNVSPLWMGVVDKELVAKYAPRVIHYLRYSKGLDFPGGVPASLNQTGEQWDFPNAWPPLVSIVVNALQAIDTDEAQKMAFDVAQTWVRACHIGFKENKQMFEKYDVNNPGGFGAGGEYTLQFGFGWSNGVVLEFLTKYGKTMTANDSQESTEDTKTNESGA